MTLKDLQIYIHKRIERLYPEGEIRSFYFILLEHYAHLSRSEVLANPQQQLLAVAESQIIAAIEELTTERPIQYIIGATEFYGSSFEVDENVLIPRQETEELVDWIITEVGERSDREGKPIRIVDIGCGSGCIAISLAKHLKNSVVTALDISENALVITRRNAERNGVSLQTLQADVLTLEALPDTYDIIVSNPPYVRESEKKEIQRNVLDFEPHLALFVSDENSLVFYKKITQLALQSLSEGGVLFFEINQYLPSEMRTLIEGFFGFQMTLRNDLLGNARMVKVANEGFSL